MSCSEAYAPQLRARGYRMTPQRHAILHTLCHANRSLTPAEVCERARKQFASLTEPTVYRTLDFLAENDLIRSVRLNSGRLVYEIAGPAHHHLICRRCGQDQEVKHQLIQSMYQKLESFSGYQITDLHTTFFGLCPKCKQGA
ncbi:MAG: transcriptional repressor [Anaerolineales bacterium]|nr:transcriptional repressor [Anaerolineales bacterium]